MPDNDLANPVTGLPSTPSTAPAPVPPRRPLRRALVNNVGLPAPIIPYTKSTGISPLLAATEGYQGSDNFNDEPSTFVPSFLGVKGALYLTGQQLAANDRFLKETSDWHPLLDEAYISVLFIYHILRVRRALGDFSSEELNTLVELEEKYPPASMHIPGVYVHFFQSISTTEAPYPWLAKIGPRLPSTILTDTSGSRAFLLGDHEMTIFPHPLAMLEQLTSLAREVRTPATNTIFEWFQSAFTNSIRSISVGDIQRWYYLTPHGRLPTPSTARVDNAFYANNVVLGTQQAQNHINRSKFDLPRISNYNAGHTTPMSLPEFMGLVDYAVGSTNRQYRNWLNAYSAIIAKQCKYIHGSRSLADIPVAGLGASTPVWTYTPQTFLMEDPNDHQPAGDFSPARRRAFNMLNLAALGVSRDPELALIALQHSALAQVNVSMSQQTNIWPADALIRFGPFWTMPICENEPVFDTARKMLTNIPNMVSSVAV